MSYCITAILNEEEEAVLQVKCLSCVAAFTGRNDAIVFLMNLPLDRSWAIYLLRRHILEKNKTNNGHYTRHKWFFRRNN